MMSKKRKVLLVSLAILLTSCASVQQTMEDIQYAATGPNISYTQNQVKVLYNDYRTAPYKQGQQIFLASEEFGGLVAVGQFKAVKLYPAARTFALVAIMQMPTTVPNTSEDSCFYVVDSKRQNTNILAVRPNFKEAGFVNEIWQANIAKDAQLSFLDSKLESNKEAKKQLAIKHAHARSYLSNSAIYENNICQLPPNATPRPIDPLNNAFSDTKYTGYAMCHVVDYRNIPTEKRPSYYFDLSNQSYNRYETKDKRFQKALEEIINFQNEYGTKTILRDYFEYVDSIYKASQTDKESCTSRSSCNTFEKLFFGSSNRNFNKHYEQCAQMIGSKLNKQKSKYVIDLNVWEQAPYALQNACNAQKSIVMTYEENMEKILSESRQTQLDLHRVSAIKKHLDATNYWRNSTTKTCAVNENL